MERRKIVDPEGYQIYGLGEWGEIGGLILHNWEIGECSKNPADYDDFATGQDFGFNHANAILPLGIKDDVIYITKEIYVFEKDTAEIIELAKDIDVPTKSKCGVIPQSRTESRCGRRQATGQGALTKAVHRDL